MPFILFITFLPFYKKSVEVNVSLIFVLFDKLPLGYALCPFLARVRIRFRNTL